MGSNLDAIHPVHLHAADALHEAIIRGHVDEQRRLVEQCADIVNRRVAVDFGGRRWADCTPLHFAALADQPDAARLLLDHGADSDLECWDRATPLDLAMGLDGAGAVEVLLTHPRAKRPASSRLNYMLYQEVTSRQNLAKMKVLIEHGADAGHPSGFASRAPLHQAVSLSLGNYLSAQQREAIIARNVATARFLLESGAEVDQRDSYGQTALHLAAEHDIGSEEIARFLLRAGADPDAADDDGDTPLHVASYHKNVKGVKALVEHGADVTRAGRRGRTPLHRALEPDRNYGYRNVDEDSVLAIVALLVEAGADVNAVTTDAGANTPLDVGFPSERVEDYLRLNGALHSRDLQESGTTRDALL